MSGINHFKNVAWKWGGQEAATCRCDASKDLGSPCSGDVSHGEFIIESNQGLKCCNDTDCTPRMMKQAFLALTGEDWEEYKSIFRVEATDWAFDRIQEAFENAAKDETRKLGTVQEVMLRSTDYLRRIIALAGGQGGVTMSYLCPHCNSFPMEDYVWWVSAGKKHTSWWCAICGEQYDWKQPNMRWWCKQAKVLTRPRSSERTRHHKVCVHSILTNLCEGSRKGPHGGA